jgi:glycosyltransferase involved in cell wall biosynthesis
LESSLPKIRVAVDAHAIGQRQTGNEVYVRSLVQRFPRLAPDIDFIGYTCCTQGDEWLPEAFCRRRVARNPLMRLGLELAGKAQSDRADLLHVQYTAPLQKTVPIVVTIHDVSFIERPEYLPWSRAQQLRWSVRRTVSRAAKILTVSEFSRRAIARAYDLDPADIVVTPNAAQEQFRPVNHEMARQQVAERLGVHRPFLLNVGDLHPRKNQIGLVQAFRALLDAHPDLPHMLLMVGKHTWFAPRVIEEVRRNGLQERVVFTKFVDDEFLPTLYNAADLFVFPSHYEGFGLPAIEAMACGRPVVCSDATALPEVVDGAAILFSPDSVGDQMRAIRDVLLDQELARRMEKKSLQRAKYFDWRETALKTLDVYYEVAAAGTRRPAPQKELVAR